MSRKMSRKARGGFFGSWGNSLSNWWGRSSSSYPSSSSYLSSPYQSSSSYPSSSYQSSPYQSSSYQSSPSSYPSSPYQPQQPYQDTSYYSQPQDSYSQPSYSSYGGRRSRRSIRGGFKDNVPLTGLAAHASPISGIRTPHVKTWVGGKTRRRHVHSKRCRHRRK